MIIVEGPDGAGKSMLVARLALDLGLPVHERAVADRTGPDGRDLWGWVCRDVMTWDVQPISIYDRHPMVSEYIYGSIIRKTLPSGFLHPSSKGIFKRVLDRSMMIFALPDLETVRVNAHSEVEQMKGVTDNLDSIYWTYRSVRANWAGWAVDYDYRVPAGAIGLKGSYESVLRSARVHLATWESK